MGRLSEFWRLAFRLKNEPRRGWAQSVHVRKIESVADHSFGVAILALFEAERRGYDLGYMVKLALIHDLEEAFTGDLTPRDKRRLTMRIVWRRRRLAKQRMLALTPVKQRLGYEKAWRDLRYGRTREARLVKELDKLEMALQAKEYELQGANVARLSGFYVSARKALKDEVLKRVLDEVVDG